jgi:lambda family phage portal protein
VRKQNFIGRLASRFRAEAPLYSPYTTAGTGQRSIRWRPSAIGPNAAIDYGQATLRNQSRDLVRKNALAGSAVERIVSNAVGTGIRPMIADAATADLWTRWTDESASDGTLDFYGQQAQAMSSVVTAGEVFVRLRARRMEDGLTVPLQLEVLEAEFVDSTKNEQLQNGNIVRMGIEFNKIGRRVAYWMFRAHPGDNNPGINSDTNSYPVPASEVLHVYLPNRPGQVRGEPWMARVLARLKELDDYDNAELTRKKTAALFAGFIRRIVPEGMSEAELVEMWGEDNAEVNNGVGDVTLEPGTMQILNPGEDVTFADPKDVGTMYEVFKRSHQRDIAAALGVLYEQLTGDYSQVNDRTWRAAVNDFRRRVEQWQHNLLVFQFCRPVWRRWVEVGQIAGSGVAGSIDPLLPVKWTPQAWPYINPVQDIQARREEVRAGFTSRTAVVSERGEDAEVIDAENKADNDRADTLELTYESDGRKAVSKGETPEPEPMTAPAPASRGER